MDRKKKIEEEIARTLEEFDRVERLPEDPYFYTRLQARLRERFTEKTGFFKLLRPAIVTALLLLNIVTAFFYLSTDTSSQTTDSRQQTVLLISKELGIEQSENNIFNLFEE